MIDKIIKIFAMVMNIIKAKREKRKSDNFRKK